MSDNYDWGGGDWWDELPPNNSGEWDDWENEGDDYWGFIPEDIPPVPDFPEYDPQQSRPDDYIPESVYDAWDFLVDLSGVDPSQIRGTAFNTIYEAVSWLEGLGLLGFSSVVQSGDFFYPVVGDSQIEGAPNSFDVPEIDAFEDYDDEPF